MLHSLMELHKGLNEVWMQLVENYTTACYETLKYSKVADDCWMKMNLLFLCAKVQ